MTRTVIASGWPLPPWPLWAPPRAHFRHRPTHLRDIEMQALRHLDKRGRFGKVWTYNGLDKVARWLSG